MTGNQYKFITTQQLYEYMHMYGGQGFIIYIYVAISRMLPLFRFNQINCFKSVNYVAQI